MINRTITGTKERFLATVRLPGDKSLSHRALLFAGMAEGDSLVTGLGYGLDIASTAMAMRALGVGINDEQVRSPGIRRWRTPPLPINCGNSGTTMRLLAGALATSRVRTTLVGDPSLMKRDMSRLEDPLAAIGGRVKATNGTAPLVVGGADMVGHADVTIPMASAQVRTAFELAALAGDASSTIDSPAGFRDHTERWLSAIGRGEFISETRFRIDPGPIPPARFDVPGDPSSGAFLWAAAAISPGSTIVTPHVSLNPGRLGFLEILERMGAQVQAVVTDSVGGDPVGTVTVTGATLEGVTVAGALATAALDELPLVAVVAAYADGITTVRDAGELRAKESDRIGTIEAMLVALGGGIAVVGDGFDVVGTGFLDGGVVDPHHDHRIAMAGAVAATRASRDVEIVDSNVVEVSWPEFYDVLGSLWS